MSEVRETFVCAICKHTFIKIRPAGEAEKEYEQWFPLSHAAEEETAIVCDPCWRFAVYGPPSEGVFLA